MVNSDVRASPHRLRCYSLTITRGVQDRDYYDPEARGGGLAVLQQS
jgi:hypothetical protein